MPTGGALTPFQREVALVFFALTAADGFLLAGGAALVAQDLSDRPTQDLDLFTARIGGVPKARDAFAAAARARGWKVTRIKDSPTFCRLEVHGDVTVLVDLAIDSPPIGPPIVTLLGPSYNPEELAGRKLLALFDRAAPRDFVDVLHLTARYDKDTLVEWARRIDSGMDDSVLADMMGMLSRFRDVDLPIRDEEAPALRAFFAQWQATLHREGR
ncbi:MAG: nucleotidyl transferase AbiEii/AbiGii toxin family protein [Actinobacteria bacterium]|nr:nucleotidyl transferase AbiEii/AbiGii toxin family protein [Actinomycetota bacterium]MCG2802802.1 nucleotidyl transferase AbiEii/AbiGii toxin family protein [Cellulomonas sp.]